MCYVYVKGMKLFFQKNQHIEFFTGPMAIVRHYSRNVRQLQKPMTSVSIAICMRCMFNCLMVPNICFR